MVAWTLCTLLVLAGIAYEDLRTRQVHVGLFALLCGSLLVRALLLGNDVQDWMFQGLLNMGVVALLLGLLWAYMRVRHGGRPSLFDAMGAGDVVLFALLAFAFPGPSFLLFLIGALLFTLVAHFIVRRLLRTQEPTVATAGWVSICFGAHLLVGLCLPGLAMGH